MTTYTHLIDGARKALISAAEQSENTLPAGGLANEYDIALRIEHMRRLHDEYLGMQMLLARELNEVTRPDLKPNIPEYVGTTDDAFSDLMGGYRRAADQIAQERVFKRARAS